MKQMLAGVLALLAAPVLACDATTPCKVGDRSYLIAQPDATIKGAVIYLHGYGGSGAKAMRNQALVQSVLDRGYAFVAPTGVPMRAGRSGFRWAFRGEDQAAEFAFLNALRDDLDDRFGISAQGQLLGGFSNGAFMVAYLACQQPDAFPAYAAVSGGFWRPDPEACAGPVDLHMTQGWVDPVVPIEGRILRGDSRDAPNAVVQGDIFRTLEIFREAGQCPRNLPSDHEITEGFWIRRWSCAEGREIEFALHPRGHAVPKGWADLALDWFEAR